MNLEIKDPEKINCIEDLRNEIRTPDIGEETIF